MVDTAQVIALAVQNDINLREVPYYPEGDECTLCKPYYPERLPRDWSGDFADLVPIPIAPAKLEDILVAFKEEPVANATMLDLFKRVSLPAKFHSKRLLILGSQFRGIQNPKKFVIALDVDASGTSTQRRQFADVDEYTPVNCVAVVFRD
jgi:hypothetical protein